jgi:hypothetical protein
VVAVSLKPLYPVGISPEGRNGGLIAFEWNSGASSFVLYEFPPLWGGQERLICE